MSCPWLTGSASMTTSTVAFPGVSRLTRGVRIVCPACFTDCSMAGNWRVIIHKSIKNTVGKESISEFSELSCHY